MASISKEQTQKTIITFVTLFFLLVAYILFDDHRNDQSAWAARFFDRSNDVNLQIDRVIVASRNLQELSVDTAFFHDEALNHLRDMRLPVREYSLGNDDPFTAIVPEPSPQERGYSLSNGQLKVTGPVQHISF